jgi:hypothetical protein
MPASGTAMTPSPLVGEGWGGGYAAIAANTNPTPRR